MTSDPCRSLVGMRTVVRMSRMALRPLPWVASILYTAVLVAGLYFQLAGLAPATGPRIAVFTAVLLTLLVGEVAERRRFGMRTPRRLAVVLLVARLGLYVSLSTVDPSGFSRTLYLLVPFTAYFSLGRRASYALAAGCLGLVVATVSATPGWYRQTEIVSDLLMFVIGLTFAVSMAAVAAEAEASRTRAERLLGDLEESHRQLGEYASQVATLAAVTERNRLARDIHDSLGHHLTAVSVQLEKAAAFRHRDEDASARALADARRSARFALEDVRHSVGTLRTGGTFALGRAVAELAGSMGDTTVDLNVIGDESGYGGPALLALYRAAQEGLTNVRKHAEASKVSVVLDLGEREASLRVADDGRGFHASVPTDGFGLQGMRERLELVGGTMTVESEVGAGTRLTIRVPRVATS
jgi:signal transduction histidine kinase